MTTLHGRAMSRKRYASARPHRGTSLPSIVLAPAGPSFLHIWNKFPLSEYSEKCDSGRAPRFLAKGKHINNSMKGLIAATVISAFLGSAAPAQAPRDNNLAGSIDKVAA